MKFLNRFKRKSNTEQPPTPVPEKPASTAPNPALRPAVYPQKRAQRDSEEVKLELGDFLHRIPPHLLVAGPHDLMAELRFEIQDLSDRINNGQTTVSLSEIYKRLPDIFRGKILDSDNIEVRFPWQKLAKLVNLSGPGKSNALQPDAAAEALAEKLRTKRHTPPAAEQPKPTPHVLPGHGDRAGSWFSSPIEAVTTAQSSASLPTLPSAKKEPASQPAELEPQTRLVMPNPEPNLKMPRLSAASEVPVKNMIQDLRALGLPQEFHGKVAAVQGEYERQFAELEKQRLTLIESRDAAHSEVQKLQHELAQTEEALAVEKTTTEINEELLAKSSAELVTLRDSSKLAEVIAERDALLQQKAYLSSQMAEMNKRGASPAATGPITTSGAPGARHLEEAQRRILGMEASQRETALELSREKEARAKVEKLLLGAERLQEQSANYMESTKGEIRKEIEASVKQRETELRKAQKELQDQVAALSDQARKSATELDNARNRAAALEQNGHAPLETQPDAMQAQAIAQLEEDIEQYRNRLKALIAERDAARAEAAQARSHIHTTSADAESHAQAEADAREELFTTLDHHHTSVLRANEDLTRRLADAENTLQIFTIERAAAATGDSTQNADPALLAELGKLRTQHADTARARDEALASAEARDRAHQESEKTLQSLASEQQQILVQLSQAREQSAEHQRNLEASESEIALLREQLAAQKEQPKHEDGELFSQHKNDAAEAHAAALRDQHASATQAHETVLEEKHKLLTTLAGLEKSHTATLLSLTQERDQARSEREALGEELSGARKQHQCLLVSFEEDRAALAAARETIQKKVSALEQHRSELTGNLEARENFIAEQEQKHREIHESHQATANELEGKLAALAEQFNTAQSAHDEVQRHASEQLQAKAEAEQELTHRLAESDAATAAAKSALQQAEQTIAAAAEKAQAQAESAAQEIARLAESDAAAKGATESAKADGQQTLVQLEAAAHEIEQLRKAHEDTNAELHFKNQQHAEVAATLDGERGQHSATRSELDSTVRRLTESEATLFAARAAQQQAEKAIAALTEKSQTHIEAATREAAQHRDAHEKANAELLSQRQLHTEVAAQLEDEHAKHAATFTQLENATQQLAENEAAAKAAREQAEQSHVADLEKARAQSEAAASENEQLQVAARVQQEKLAAAESAAADATTKIKAELDELRVALQIARRERDETRQQSDTTIIQLQKRAESAEESITALRTKLESATAAREEALASLKTLRDEHESTSRHRDELATRITHIADRHRRLLEDIGSTATPAPVAPPAPAAPAMNVIEVHNPEVFAPEPSNGIPFPRIRPVPIPPPRVQSQ